MSEIIRHWYILRHLPTESRYTTVQQLKAMLEERLGEEVSERKIQRDLNKLSGLFPLVQKTKNKPYEWAWSERAPTFELPVITVETALTLLLTLELMGHALPPSVLTYLERFRERATARVSAGGALGGWLERFRAIPQGMPFVPPEIGAELIEIIYGSVLRGIQVEIQYLRLEDGREETYRAEPLGLVARDRTLYLVCTLKGREDVRALPLHRILRAELTGRPRVEPSGFTLDGWLERGGGNFPLEPARIRLRARVFGRLGRLLEEAPLDKSQRLEADGGGGGVGEVRVLEVEVAHTMKLVGWLLSQGPLIEVLEPADLRERIGRTLAEAAGRYSSPTV